MANLIGLLRRSVDSPGHCFARPPSCRKRQRGHKKLTSPLCAELREGRPA